MQTLALTDRMQILFSLCLEFLSTETTGFHLLLYQCSAIKLGRYLWLIVEAIIADSYS